ncbi:MAG: (2Fe-2S)-binding protein [Thermoguttaceae bacterium]
MQPHDEVCLCFHVTRKKVENFIRLHRPRRAAQLSDCFGAGTGCGWCRPVLQRLFDAAADAGQTPDFATFQADEYAQGRLEYRAAQRQQPPAGP